MLAGLRQRDRARRSVRACRSRSRNVGQTFYGFGWELQLVETGFLCIFLCPLARRAAVPAPAAAARRRSGSCAGWPMRIMWGAGLIKLRGDSCWRDLTCLDFHFETQPIPSPLSALLSRAAALGARGAASLFNHVVELGRAVPDPRPAPPARIVAGALMVALQIILIPSGNLAFLNWLTLVPILACFDDGVWRRLLPRALVGARGGGVGRRGRRRARRGWSVAVAARRHRGAQRVAPVLNMLSGAQIMNTSFTRLPLVNTYGAFGSVGRERAQLVFEGTTDETMTPETTWLAYAFKCQPGDPARRPCWMSPYHHRLDWLLWFAAMGSPRDYPWAVHLVWKLLVGRSGRRSGSSASDPFAARGRATCASTSTATGWRRSARRPGGSARGSAPGCRRSPATTRSSRAFFAARVGCGTIRPRRRARALAAPTRGRGQPAPRRRWRWRRWRCSRSSRAAPES